MANIKSDKNKYYNKTVDTSKIHIIDNENTCSINKKNKIIIIDESTSELSVICYKEELKYKNDILGLAGIVVSCGLTLATAELKKAFFFWWCSSSYFRCDIIFLYIIMAHSFFKLYKSEIN